MNADPVSSAGPAAGAISIAGKYLTFLLGRESYGIPVVKVREIIRFITPTFVPQMPDYVKGVINLRGRVIPVVDLRTRFKLADANAHERTCIVVVQVTTPAGRTLAGLVVDGVEEVAQIGTNEIEPTPDFGPALNTAGILGMANIRGSVKMLLDIDQVVTSETLADFRRETQAIDGSPQPANHV
jgi:purine-binding chemotaxis protein CheW